MTRRQKVALVLALLVLLAVGGAVAAWIWNERQTEDVRGSSTREFDTTEEPGATTTTATTTEEADPSTEEVWPTYGYDVARTRAAPFRHRPPYEDELWRVRARGLLEFPPVIAYGRLYVCTGRGRFLAVEAETGEIAWERDLGRFSAASPTVADGLVFQPLMNKLGEEREGGTGEVVALDAETGEVVWRFRKQPVESSPLHVDGLLYFGTFDDKLYALDAQTGRVRWSFETGGDVKGGPVFARGTVYFGSYDGKVYALDARTGKLQWDSSGQSGLRGAGRFYATPTFAYGRVYIGSTDGKIYSFGARSGDLIWSHGTGGYVYSSAAVFRKTVYAGSYDRHLYALDAATGDLRWRFAANGPVSGAATVIDGVVYFATFGDRTYALDARTGERLWTFRDGRYTPIVADTERVYIVGQSTLYAFQPSGS